METTLTFYILSHHTVFLRKELLSERDGNPPHLDFLHILFLSP